MALKKEKKGFDALSVNPLLQQVDRIRPFVEENIRQIGAIFLVICIVTAGLVWWTLQERKNEQEAQSLFAATLNFMTGGTNQATDNTSLVYEKALGSFNAIIDTYPETPAGLSSRVYAGVCSYRLGQYEAAGRVLEEYLKEAPSEQSALRAMAQENLGYIYEEQKRYREALQYFEDARENQSGIAAASGMLNCARCFENLGETPRACQYYKEFIEKFPSSTFIAFVRAKVSALCNS